MIDLNDPFVQEDEIYDLLLESQWWTFESLRDFQREQLGRFLRYARSNVPFYSERLDVVLRHDGTVDWSRWNEVPCLERRDLQLHSEKLLTVALPPGHGPSSSILSSGSTGMPIRTTHPRVEARAEYALVARMHEWRRLNFDKDILNIKGDNPAEHTWPNGTLVGRWSPKWMPSTAGQLWYLNLLTSPENALEFLSRRPFTYLAGLPSRIEALAYAAQRLGVKRPLEAILTRGQEATVAQQALFDEVFGARTLPSYAAQETGTLAQPCPECGRFHINSESMLVETVDGVGLPVGPGQIGEVVVTPFLNTAQPLIRYRIGDLAILGAPCPCGRGLPTLERIAGRTYHQFRRADGGTFVPALAEDILAKFGVGLWQLAQIEFNRAEFRFVTKPLSRVASDDELREAVSTALPPGMQLDIRHLPAFEPANGGKHILYVCELAPT